VCGQKRQILRTPQYLFTRPGCLTREIIEGRRVRYITPVRLYLSMIALFSVVFALSARAPTSSRSTPVRRRRA
jgi:hypothetical protein